MNMKINSQLGWIFATAAIGFGGNVQAQTIIDLFDDTDSQIIEDLNGPTVNGTIRSSITGSPNIILGERDISVELKTPTGASPNGVNMNISGGSLKFNNDSGAAGIGVVQWDGIDLGDNNAAGGAVAGPTGGFVAPLTLVTDGLGGIDLRAVADGFFVQTIAVDTNLVFSIGAYTDDNNFTLTTIQATGPEFLFIPFDNLENAALCGLYFGPILSVECGGVGNNQTVDMSNFGALNLVFNIDAQVTAVDIEFGAITVREVPEPGTLALLSISLLGAGVAKRRKMLKSA